MSIDIKKIKQAKKEFDTKMDEKEKAKKAENQRQEQVRGENNLKKLQEVLSEVQSPEFEKWLETQLIEIAEYYGDLKYELVFQAKEDTQTQNLSKSFYTRPYRDYYNVSIEFTPFYSDRYRYCYRGLAFRKYGQYDILDQETYNLYEQKRKDLMEEINQAILDVLSESKIKVKNKFEETDSKIIYSYKFKIGR